MAISLSKGQKVSLSKEDPSLTQIAVGLGWDPNKYSGGYDFDLDASCFMLGANGKVRRDEDFIFYKNKDSVDGAIHHSGDDRTGGNSEDGDDETILVDLSKVSPDVQKIAFTATIYEADQRCQNFGQVSNAYVRLVNQQTGMELVRYDLGEDFSIETAIVVCEIYKHGNEWKFNAVGAGFSGGLRSLCQNYGVDVE
ncbi:MAG: TerD family protein [Lachnospiraceae bacterium]|nr:TerD family protein [Lachnospiraceae bacterium]